uniref:Secreted protein n=1 Tax=Anguilla anguilla TaxID=7936 RepID=A0A0E9PCL3_ANGAN
MRSFIIMTLPSYLSSCLATSPSQMRLPDVRVHAWDVNCSVAPPTLYISTFCNSQEALLPQKLHNGSVFLL